MLTRGSTTGSGHTTKCRANILGSCSAYKPVVMLPWKIKDIVGCIFKIGRVKRWRRFYTVLTIVFFVMCLLRTQRNSGDLYYAVETVQYGYVTADEVLEEALQNWRGLQHRDVSFSVVVAHLSCFLRTAHLPGNTFTVCDIC